ncbi:HD domain-containing protein [Chryseobacterium sp.]|uniref:HD domain-containing protein n=1 Tax=Chryseobacterium sp. TaxID=1871047 RepID=UPI0025C334FC|nr:HD domain-containing protein [Chryseobacterium sp.]MBV8325635.1 hypothetical protein [Chryseobacterium sp.]
MTLKERFEQLCAPFTEDQHLIQYLWKEIEQKYTEKNRYYHNLTHLENMFQELEAVKDKVSDFTTISFSVFYHDLIYDASSGSNEKKSSVKAEKRLKELGVSHDIIHAVTEQILATQFHQQSENKDINILLDADLSILGKDFKIYTDYTQRIRKEYSIYPDFLYKPGRKKVLQHFSALKDIFKTDYFRNRYEVQARENIRTEIRLL